MGHFHWTGKESTILDSVVNALFSWCTESWFRAVDIPCTSLYTSVMDEESFDLLRAQRGDPWRGSEASYNATVLANLDEELRCRGWARKSDGDLFSTELVPLAGWTGTDASRAEAEALICMAWNLFGFERPTWDDPLGELRDAAGGGS